jgi:hypothetical protein
MENRLPNHRLTLRLPPELWEDLRDHQASVGIGRECPLSGLILRWIKQGLEREGPTLE